MKELQKVEETEAGFEPVLKVKGEGRIELGTYTTSKRLLGSRCKG